MGIKIQILSNKSNRSAWSSPNGLYIQISRNSDISFMPLISNSDVEKWHRKEIWSHFGVKKECLYNAPKVFSCQISKHYSTTQYYSYICNIWYKEVLKKVKNRGHKSLSTWGFREMWSSTELWLYEFWKNPWSCFRKKMGFFNLLWDTRMFFSKADFVSFFTILCSHILCKIRKLFIDRISSLSHDRQTDR